jgi:hypothetical protein
MTWQDLKNFVNGLDPILLKEPVLVLPICDGELQESKVVYPNEELEFELACSIKIKFPIIVSG